MTVKHEEGGLLTNNIVGDILGSRRRIFSNDEPPGHNSVHESLQFAAKDRNAHDRSLLIRVVCIGCPCVIQIRSNVF